MTQAHTKPYLQNGKIKHKMTHTRIKKFEKKEALLYNYYYPKRKLQTLKPAHMYCKNTYTLPDRIGFPPLVWDTQVFGVKSELDSF